MTTTCNERGGKQKQTVTDKNHILRIQSTLYTRVLRLEILEIKSSFPSILEEFTQVLTEMGNMVTLEIQSQHFC